MIQRNRLGSIRKKIKKKDDQPKLIKQRLDLKEDILLKKLESIEKKASDIHSLLTKEEIEEIEDAIEDQDLEKVEDIIEEKKEEIKAEQEIEKTINQEPKKKTWQEKFDSLFDTGD